MRKILPLVNMGLYLARSDNLLYYTCGRMLGKFDLNDHTPQAEREVLDKSGRYRQVLPIGDRLYIKAFCNLHEFTADSFTLLRSWKLGEDLSSDINTIRCDGVTLYASVRNGVLAAIDVHTGIVRTSQVSDTSMWDFVLDGEFLLAGNVNGALLQIGKSSLQIIKSVPAHKKNLKSLAIRDGLLYTASQDLSLKIWRADTLAQVSIIKACHKKMFYIAGFFQNHVITCCPPCRETKIWHLDTLQPSQTLNFAGWSMFVAENRLIFDQGYGIYDHELQ